MNYDIIITGLSGPRAQNLVARSIASSSGTSLQDALDQLDHLPYFYKRNLTRSQVTDLLGKLKQLGAITQVVQNTDTESSGREHAEHVAPPVKPEIFAPPQQTHAAETAHAAPVRRVLTPIEPPVTKPDRRRLYTGLAVMGVVVILAAVLINNSASLTLERSGPMQYQPDGSTAPGGRAAKQKHAMRAQKTDSGTRAVAPEQKKQSQNLVDSAAAAGADLNAVTKFYLMAISINKYNAAAWYGLIGAYTDAGKTREADDARRRMKQLFGENALGVSETVQRLGTLHDISTGDDGTLRIEYRSRHSSRDDLLEETYILARELRTVCTCPALSIYAATAGSGGVLVAIPTASFPATLADFRLTASITFLD
jgi:hypothetical protein